jgi:hypothetical protein
MNPDKPADTDMCDKPEEPKMMPRLFSYPMAQRAPLGSIPRPPRPVQFIIGPDSPPLTPEEAREIHEYSMKVWGLSPDTGLTKESKTAF